MIRVKKVTFTKENKKNKWWGFEYPKSKMRDCAADLLVCMTLAFRHKNGKVYLSGRYTFLHNILNRFQKNTIKSIFYRQTNVSKLNTDAGIRSLQKRRLSWITAEKLLFPPCHILYRRKLRAGETDSLFEL